MEELLLSSPLFLTNRHYINRISVPSEHEWQGNCGKGVALNPANVSLEYYRRFLRKLNNTLGVMCLKAEKKKNAEQRFCADVP